MLGSRMSCRLPWHSLTAQLANVANSLAVPTARYLHSRQIRVIANSPFANAENDSGDPRRQDRVVGQRVKALQRLVQFIGHWWHLPEIGFGADLVKANASPFVVEKMVPYFILQTLIVPRVHILPVRSLVVVVRFL